MATLDLDLSHNQGKTVFERKDQGRILYLLFDVNVVIVVKLTEGTNELLDEVFAVEVRGPQTNVSYIIAPNVSCNGKYKSWIVADVWHFVTCQNYHFGKYVGWSCLSVCLFVRNFHKISRTTQSIITKLGHKQALVHDSCKLVGQECRSNN